MLELQNVSFMVGEGGDGREIVRDISLSIPDGRTVVVTGPNGGGKSTLARLVAGIERPTSGRIIFDGEDITDLSITDRARRGIGFAFQPLGQKYLPAEEAAVLTVVNPFTASIMGIVIAGESLSMAKIIGYILILTALIVYNLKTKKQFKGESNMKVLSDRERSF